MDLQVLCVKGCLQIPMVPTIQTWIGIGTIQTWIGIDSTQTCWN